MKLSFATLGCPSWSIPEIVRHAHKMGYDGVELRGVAGQHISPTEPPEQRQIIRKLFADAGVEIPCLMGYSYFTNANEAERQADVQGLQRLMEVASDLGCPRVRFFGGRFGPDGRDRAVERVVACLEVLLRPAERLGVTLAMETHDDWCHGGDVRAVLERLPNPHLGICWDIANSFYIEDMDLLFPKIQRRIVHVHFKDCRLADGKHTSVLPGQGQIPLQRALELLHGSGYHGYLSFEWEKKWEPDLEEPEVAFPHWMDYTTKLMNTVGVPRG